MKPDYPLLGLLARKPASGYDLGKWLRVDGIFLGRKGSLSPVYRSLADLEQRGWVRVCRSVKGGGPEANIHSLTPEGRKALVEWAKSEYQPAPRPMAPDFMVRMNFAGQLGPEYALRIVRTELDYRRAQREEELRNPSGLGETETIEEIDDDWLLDLYHLTHDRGWQNTSLFIGWLESTERWLVEMVERKRRKAHH